MEIALETYGAAIEAIIGELTWYVGNAIHMPSLGVTDEEIDERFQEINLG